VHNIKPCASMRHDATHSPHGDLRENIVVAHAANRRAPSAWPEPRQVDAPGRTGSRCTLPIGIIAPERRHARCRLRDAITLGALDGSVVADVLPITYMRQNSTEIAQDSVPVPPLPP
jgi:hypothetical protein